ncbi:MAG TPA: methyl-accepting chemotaxis protein [Desulfobulbaceae bacterium]|nr:methyl-accepting chemotaxis protein [Desulfobulbaceae bacterium]
MSITQRFGVTSLVLVFLSVALIGVITGRYAVELVRQAEMKELNGQFSQLSEAIDFESKRAASMALELSALPSIIGAFAERDREKLLALTQHIYTTKKNELGIEQFQFHLPPATSFLRVNKPEKFGDDLSSFRYMVVEVNKDLKAHRGLEVGVTGLGIRGVVPVFHEEKHIGSLEFGLAFDQAFFESLKKTFKADYVFYAPSNKELKLFAKTHGAKEALTAEELQTAVSGTPVKKEITEGDAHYAILGHVVHDYSGKNAGVIEIVIETSEYISKIKESRNTVYGITAVILLIAGFLSLLIGRSIARPVVSMTQAMKILADGDHSVEVPGTGRKDEIGMMAAAVDVFKRNAIETEALRREQERAKKQAEIERKKTLLDMADHFETSVMGIVKGVASSSTVMRATAKSMSQIAQETSSQAASAASASTEASTNVQTVASATEELSTSVKEISFSVTNAAQIALKAADTTVTTMKTVEKLAVASNKIGEIVELINTIASRTNLLALNATIEAARAGDTGKGFAVVANEVKELANQTAKATEEITGQIASVQSETAHAVDAIRSISSIVDKVRDISASIAAAVEQQGVATNEIARNIQEASAGTNAVSKNIVSVERSTTQTEEASEQVLSTADELAQNAEELRKEVDGFLANIRNS